MTIVDAWIKGQITYHVIDINLRNKHNTIYNYVPMCLVGGAAVVCVWKHVNEEEDR